MVISTKRLRKIVSLVDVQSTLIDYGVKNTDLIMDDLYHRPIKRQPKAPPPDGSICLREASRKYKVNLSTIQKWVSQGKIPIIERRSNWLYVDEASVIKAIKASKRLKTRQ